MEIENKNSEAAENKQFELPELADKPIGIEQSDDLMNKVKNFLDISWETIKVVIISLIIIFGIIRPFIAQPFFVKGSSMLPNFHDGDYLIVNEIGYRLDKPQRGDVIIFKYPLDPSEYFIKRVIGLPGETVQIKDGKVTIYNSEKPQGFVLDESKYLDSSVITSGEIRETLGDGQYYVLGDNRPASSDSRRWGVLDKKYIIGQAWVRALPVSDFKAFDHISYNGN